MARAASLALMLWLIVLPAICTAAPRLGERLDLAATLRNEQGREVKLGDVLAGKPAVVLFVSLNCRDLCGVALLGTAELVESISTDRALQLVAISADERDTPVDAQKLSAALGSRHLRVLLGANGSGRLLADKAGVAFAFDDEQKIVTHPAGTFVVDAEGRLARWIDGVVPDPAALRLALYEASAGRIGGIAEGARLICLGYDPQRGGYAFDIFRSVRWAACACALLLGLIVFRLALHERRR